jgi:hypothetical protein
MVIEAGVVHNLSTNSVHGNTLYVLMISLVIAFLITLDAIHIVNILYSSCSLQLNCFFPIKSTFIERFIKTSNAHCKPQ